MVRIFKFFSSLTTFFSSYRFDAHIWHATGESTHNVVPETVLKSLVPLFFYELERPKKEHRVASPSLMVRIFEFFPSLSTFFLSYRFDAHIWHTTGKSTLKVMPKTVLKSLVPLFSYELERPKKETQSRVAKTYGSDFRIFSKFDDIFLELQI